jgi:hypothetical protein
MESHSSVPDDASLPPWPSGRRDKTPKAVNAYSPAQGA